MGFLQQRQCASEYESIAEASIEHDGFGASLRMLERELKGH